MSYDDRPAHAGRFRRDNGSMWTWIVIATVIVIAALFFIFLFARPGEEAVDVVDPVDPVDTVDVVEPVDEVEVVDVTDGAFAPDLRHFTIDGIEVRAA